MRIWPIARREGLGNYARICVVTRELAMPMTLDGSHKRGILSLVTFEGSSLGRVRPQLGLAGHLAPTFSGRVACKNPKFESGATRPAALNSGLHGRVCAEFNDTASEGEVRVAPWAAICTALAPGRNC